MKRDRQGGKATEKLQTLEVFFGRNFLQYVPPLLLLAKTND
jgi:hypothetical protein